MERNGVERTGTERKGLHAHDRRDNDMKTHREHVLTCHKRRDIVRNLVITVRITTPNIVVTDEAMERIRAVIEQEIGDGIGSVAMSEIEIQQEAG